MERNFKFTNLSGVILFILRIANIIPIYHITQWHKCQCVFFTKNKEYKRID